MEEETLLTLTCEDCETAIETGEEVIIENNNYCPGCAENYEDCYHCENTIHTNNMSTINGNYVCEDCENEHYDTCQGCRDLLSRDNINDDGFCNNCYQEEESNYIHSYEYKPYVKFYGKGLFLGIELEIDKGDNKDDLAQELIDIGDEKIYLKEDASLNDGLEIVSHPMDMAHHREFSWQQILKKCSDFGFKSHNTTTCGLHVHINNNFLTEVEKIKLAIFINTNKPSIEKIARRQAGHYAQFKLLKKGKLKEDACYSASRYQAINWNNLHTIEFRFFRGTLKYETFIASLEFIDALIHFIKETTVSQIYTSYFEENMINAKAFRLFCNWIAKEPKKHKNLIQFLKERAVYVCV